MCFAPQSLNPSTKLLSFDLGFKNLLGFKNPLANLSRVKDLQMFVQAGGETWRFGVGHIGFSDFVFPSIFSA